MLAELIGKRRYASTDDLRNVFGDYHNVLRWLAVFLVGDRTTAESCIVDACGIIQSPEPMFHEWLVKWGAVATVRFALRSQYKGIEMVVSAYAADEEMEEERPPLSAQQVAILIKNSEALHARLDVLCRFALVLRGVAQYSLEQTAQSLGVPRGVAARAYRVAFDTATTT